MARSNYNKRLIEYRDNLEGTIKTFEDIINTYKKTASMTSDNYIKDSRIQLAKEDERTLIGLILSRDMFYQSFPEFKPERKEN